MYILFQEVTGEIVGPTRSTSVPPGYDIIEVTELPTDLSEYKVVSSQLVPKVQADFDADLPQIKAMAVHHVNQIIAAARVQYITDLPGQDAIYDAKRKEAIDFLALDPTPTDLTGFPFLSQEAGVTAPTAYELAQLWINLSNLWIPMAAQMEGLRQTAVAAIAAATTADDVQTVVSNLTSQS